MRRFHTTTSAYDPNANSLVEESVGARKRGIRCLLQQANAPVCLGPDAAEHTNEQNSITTATISYLDRTT